MQKMLADMFMHQSTHELVDEGSQCTLHMCSLVGDLKAVAATHSSGEAELLSSYRNEVLKLGPERLELVEGMEDYRVPGMDTCGLRLDKSSFPTNYLNKQNERIVYTAKLSGIHSRIL